MKITCPHCKNDVTFYVQVMDPHKPKSIKSATSRSIVYHGNKLSRVPCPQCGLLSSTTTGQGMYSGYWRRHRCRGCEYRFASVQRVEGDGDKQRVAGFEVYKTWPSPDAWYPSTPLLAKYDANGDPLPVEVQQADDPPATLSIDEALRQAAAPRFAINSPAAVVTADMVAGSLAPSPDDPDPTDPIWGEDYEQQEDAM